MKERELRELGPCLLCQKKIGQCPLPIFHMIEMKRLGLDGRAVQRQAGLEQFMGSVALAQAMGPDEDMTMELGAAKVMVCDDCFYRRLTPLSQGYEDADDSDN